MTATTDELAVTRAQLALTTAHLEDCRAALAVVQAALEGRCMDVTAPQMIRKIRRILRDTARGSDQ